MTAIWRLRDVALRGRQSDRLSVSELEIGPGVVAVLGQSGAGKSSLLGLLAGFESPARGRVDFDAGGFDTQKRSRPDRFWSPQDHGLWSHLTVREHIEVVQVRDDQRSAIDWLRLFDLEGLAGSMPGELSMGERSRLSVLRALASQAQCLVMDEPLAHVDEARVDRYWQVLERHIADTNATFVFSTHDAVCVRRFADRCVCLEQGRVAYFGETNSLYFEPPSESTAWLLGPANLVGTSGFEQLLEVGDLPICLRPHEIRFVPDTDGRRVHSTRRINGGYAVVFDAEDGPTIYLAQEPSGAGRLEFEAAAARNATNRAGDRQT